MQATLSALEAAPAYDELVEFYKALIHPVRLRVAGLLASGPRDLLQLSRELGEPVTSLPRHLSVLLGAGLVREVAAGRFEVDLDGLRKRARKVPDSARTRALAGARDERSRVLASFFRDGRLTVFPAGDQRKLIVLDEIAVRFEPDRTYAEREVNMILRPIFGDYSTIRRALVDYHYMNRQRGVYWLGEARRAGNEADAPVAEQP